MKNRFLRQLLLLCVVLLIAILFISAVDVQAAEKKLNILNSSYEKTSCNIDLDGDGEKEKLEMKTQGNNDFISTLTLFVDGKKALVLDQLLYDTMAVADYIKMSDSDIFLRLCISGNNDFVSSDYLYRYHASEKKLIKEIKLLDMEQSCSSAEIKSVTALDLNVSYRHQFSETGSIQWTGHYMIKNGRLELEKKAVKAKSSYSAEYGDVDGYGKLFQKNKFKAKIDLQLYQDTSMSAAAYTAHAGEILKLKKLKYVDHIYYVQFSKDRKNGWLKIDPSNTETVFYGVESRLAG